MKNRLHFLIIALLLHIPLFAYPILRLCDWLGLDGWTTAAIFIPLFFSQLVVRLYLRHANFGLVFWLRRAADLWLGIAPLLLGMLLLMEIPVGLGWIAPPTAAWTLLGMTLALTLYSVWNAYSPSVVKVELNSSKLTAPLRFAQITDVHIGSRSAGFLERVMQQVDSLDIEFLCITGDFIDAPGIGLDKLAPLRNCRVPIYFSIGNHERYEDLDDILQRLATVGVQVLRSRSIVHGEAQVIGIDDSGHPAQVKRQLPAIAIDPRRFVLLLYHRPHGLADAAHEGVDLMICGHTHNGQIVPFNLVVGRVFEQVVGLFRHGETQLYVSPGTGTWGPVMRLGSRGEVTYFEIQPQASAH
jgi:predicted MPP superfamily phosphohydrolase